MSASWDSDLSSIIEKTNNNLKLLRKIGDKPQVRAPDVSVTSSPASARPRAFIGAQDDAGSTSSRGSARPRAFIRGDDDTSSMGSHGSVRPKAYVRGDDDTGSMGSHTSARPKAFIRTDDDSGSVSSRASARPKAFIRPEDDAGSASSRASARPKAFIRADDDSGSVSSRASARPKAFVRGDDDVGSISSRSSARPKAFIRGDDDTGSMSSRSSARPKAFIRGDDDAGSMSSNQGLGRSRLDSGHGSVASSSGRPHVGIAGGGGLTAAMLQQHRATAGPAGPGGLSIGDLGAARARYDLDETRSMSGVSASRLRRPLGANGRVPHARSLGASMGPRIRVPDADIPSDIPSHVIDEIKQSLETQFASRNGAVDKKVADLRTDVAGLTTQTSSLSAQISELRDAVLVSANSHPSANAPSVSDPKIFASVQANAAAIARLEEHSADLLGRKVSVDRELTELGSRVKSMSSATMKISTLEDNIEALVANRQKQEQGLFKLADRVQLMHRQMGSLVDMKAVENLLSIRLTREFREMEDRLSQNVIRMAEKMEQKVQNMEKQSFSQRQESLATLKNDLTDDIQRLQSSSLRKSDLLSLQNAQTQSKEDLAQLSNALDRQEKKLQDAKLANSTLRDELADARTELNKALQSQQRSAAALMEEKLEHITNSNKEKSSKFDDQLSELAKKQKKLEEATKTLQETMTQVRAETGQRLSRSSADREEENDKLRQRLARSVAELEALATTKAEVERRFTSEEQQFQARLKELRSTLTETEKQKEAQRLELMQKLQEESKLMGVAQGKNSLLENLLAREKAENEEKNELVRKSKKEVSEVREQIRNLESEKEKKVRQLTSELQAKQTQVGLLTKTLKRIETASAKMLDLSKREAKTVRRVKATKEHELFIAQLKLKEMERVAQALQNGDEMKKQAALTAASTEERNELEKLLLESQLEKDELKQELEEMTEEFNAAKESQKVIMEDTITKLSSDYDEKISELKQQIADKEQAMRQLRDTLVEKSNLDALEDELAALKDEKNDLLEKIQRAQIEHERITLNTETNLRLEHATEFAAMKSKFEERISELEDAKSELETTKTTIAELEKELENQEALHQREVSNLTQEIKEARSKIDECTAQILELEEAKASLEGEISQMEANIGGASAEKEEELVAIKSQMQSEVDKLRAELAEVSSSLDERQTQLKDAKQSDEANRQRLVEMAMAQEEMQGRYVSQIDSLTLKLNQERESSRAREQDLEDTIDKLNADVKSLKAESSKELEAARSELTDQLTELTTTLKTSQHREQQLQSRLKRILEELVQAANASGENAVAEDVEMSDDEAITHHLDALYATHRRTAHELERLQAEYELTVKQAAADSATAQELDNQVKEHETQIKELESVVEQLREELKEQYHKSAVIAKGSDEFSDEMASLREEKRQLERQLQEEEKDRAKREVSYQRRTEMKEREVEELRTENKTLTAAVAAVREKIRAVENVKFQDLGELQSKLKDLEERTAALQPDENNIANMEKDFTATRQEIVTLTAEVQSLYQKLTACCGIMEWSELRASVFDEEEKLTRVRVENARELAKVESVEQEVLMNAEFLNALLVAHGSTGGDDNLLNDFRWMQKYASIAPEIVEKLRKVESRLRDAVLDLHDGSSSLFPDGTSKASVNSNEAVARPPKSQNSAVDGAAIALALEKARDDYFSETSEAAEGLDDEDVKHDVDQPDVEQESVDLEGEGADYENVDAEGQDSIGDMCHDESGTCDDELVVAEHVVRDEQEISHEEQGLTSVGMSNLDEELSVDVAKDSVKSKQDRNDDVDGLVSSVDDKVEDMAKIQSKWNSVGFSGDGEDDAMDEVERLMLERSLVHSSKQVNPDIDNECDASDEFATSIVHADTEEKQSAAVSDEVDGDSADDSQLKAGDSVVNVNCDYVQPELSDADQDVRSEEEADEIDPLEESSFDNAMMIALEGRESHSSSSTNAMRRTVQTYEVEAQADQSDSEGYVIQDAITESSIDDSMLSENDDESSEPHFANESDVHNADFHADDQSATVKHQNSRSENSYNGDGLSDSEISVGKVYERVVEQIGGTQKKEFIRDISLAESPSRLAGDLGGQTEVDDEVGKSQSIIAYETARVHQGSTLSYAAYTSKARDAVEKSTSSLGSGALRLQLDESNELEKSTICTASSELVSSENEYNVLKVSSSRLDRGDFGIQHEEGNALEESSSSLANGAPDSEDAVENVNSFETTPAVALRMEDESSEEEETMTVQSQPTYSANLSRFSMGTRRLHLEEDDEMDEIERLLLDQSAPSMQKNQQQPSRLTRPSTDDDDEFGESSFQSRGDDDEFDEHSDRSREDNEDRGEISVRPRDDEFGKRSVRPNLTEKKQQQQPSRFMRRLEDGDDEFGESSLQSHNDDENEEFGEDSIRSLDRVYNENSIERAATDMKSVERTEKLSSIVRNAGADEFEESNELEESITSIASRDQLDESGTLEESTSSVRSAQLKGISLKESVSRVENVEFEQHDESDLLEESTSSVKSGALTEQTRESHTTVLSETSVRNRAPIGEFGTGIELEQPTSSIDNSVLAGQDDENSVLDESSSSLASAHREGPSEKSHDRTFSRTAHEGRKQDDGDGIHMLERNAQVVSRTDLLAESSFDADMQSDRDDEGSASSDAERTTRLIKCSEGEDEWSEEQIRAAERSLDRTLDPEDDLEGSVETTPAVALRMEDESSEEEETMTVQSQPTYSANLSRFSMGTRRLHLEEDDEMDEIERLLLDQSAPSMQKNQQQPSRLTRPSTDDDDEFGEMSIKPLDGGNSIETSGRLHEFGVASIESKLRDEDEFGEITIRSSSQKDDVFSKPSRTPREVALLETPSHFKQHEESRFESPMRSESHESNELSEGLRDGSEFGQSFDRSRKENKFGETSVHPKAREEDEVGEASIRTGSYDEEDFGEISIPLDEGTTLCPPVPSRLHDTLDAGRSTRTSNISSRETIYHEGLMRSPVKSPRILNTTTSVARDDSASEGDYMDESFDLEESLEEEDHDERLV